MATILQNRTERETSDTGVGLGLILAIILVVALGVLLFALGIPALQNEVSPTNGSLQVVPETSRDVMSQ